MEQPSFIFTSEPISLKNEGENFFVEGYISTSDLDQVNDIVTKACLLDMAEQMKSRTIKFDVEHESFRGKSNLDMEINKTKIPVAKTDDFLMDKKGIKVRAMLNPFSPRFEEVKGSIDGGFLDAFSIAYVPVKSVIEERNGLKVRLLDKINLLNVAFTGNPVNTEARMTNVFAKSLEFLEEQDNIHRSDKLNLNGGKKMTEETKDIEVTKKDEEVEDDEETEEETTEETEEDEDDTEVKSLKLEVKSLNDKIDAQAKDIAEMKATLKKPVHKSTVSVEDKSENFVEEKSQNPLDLIA